MSYIYAKRKTADPSAQPAAAPQAVPQAAPLAASRPGAPARAHRVDLPDNMRSKMENAFGADLSAVRLYESQTVADAGAQAVMQGSSIAFAPGMLDFSSYGGQALLGHELSHVVSQQRGEARGSGFLNDRAMEARADREGAMAAAGQQIAMPAAAVSSLTAAPAAGPMQAKKGTKKQLAPARRIAAPEGLPSFNSIRPRSEHADDFDLLNSQTGTNEERRQAYNNIASPALENVDEGERKAISEYISGSMAVNTYLRGQTDNIYYPQGKYLQEAQEMAGDISSGIQKNPLQENLTTFRGTTDKFLAMLLLRNRLKKAVNKDGTVNHAWLNRNQKKLRKALIGSVYSDKGFTSTSTEKSFAQEWSRTNAVSEKMLMLNMQGKDDPEFRKMVEDHPEKTPGAHLLTMNLPRGAKAAFVDRMSDKESQMKGGEVNQREVLIDKGASFKIRDIRKMEDADSYELVMDLLEEEGKKQKKK